MDRAIDHKLRGDAPETDPELERSLGLPSSESGKDSAPQATDEPGERATLAAWLGVAAGTIGSFMATLDMTIVNASLPTIQGELGATPSEGTWVSTSYLIAEICIIPLTAWLTRMLGLRRLVFFGAAGFTVFSVLCGFATDLTELVFGRVGQGLCGAMLMSSSFTIVATRLPPKQQPIGLAVGGLTAVLGPILGPLIGGSITESFSWHYLFFMNVPICAVVLACCLAGLPKARGEWHELAKADWLGIAGMMLALGPLTTLLELGHRNQWFESPMICGLALTSALGFIMVGIGQLRSERPVIRLALLRNPGLAAPVGLQTMGGVLLFGSLFTVPQFLAAVAGYNAEQSGWVILTFGTSAILGAALYPILMKKLDIRAIVAIGFMIQAAASWLSTGLTSASVGHDFTRSLMFVGIGITLASIPQHQAAMSASTPENASETSSMLMIARNLGGSLGLAMIASFHEMRIDVHHWQLNGSLQANDIGLQHQIASTAQQFGGGQQGEQAAYRLLDGQVRLDALVMSFNDVFLMFSLATLAAMPLILFLRPVQPGTAAARGH